MVQRATRRARTEVEREDDDDDEEEEVVEMLGTRVMSCRMRAQAPVGILRDERGRGIG
jgi:hypothetical protein